MNREPTIERWPMDCTQCRHQWTGPILQNVAAKVWVAYVESLCCPKCHASSRSIRLCNPAVA